MAVSSLHPHQLPNPGTWAQGSRWPKGGASDNQPSDGTWCTDFGNLTIDFRWLFQKDPHRGQRANPPRLTEEAEAEEWVTHPESQKKPKSPEGGPSLGVAVIPEHSQHMICSHRTIPEGWQGTRLLSTYLVPCAGHRTER